MRDPEFIAGLERGVKYAQEKVTAVGSELKQLDPHKENFYRLIKMGLKFEETWRAAAALALALFKYVEAKRYSNDLKPLLQSAISWCKADDVQLHGRLLNRLGQILRINEEFDEAKQILFEGLKFAEMTADPDLQVDIHWNLAAIYFHSPENLLDEAEHHAHLASGLQSSALGKVLNILGMVAGKRGQYKEAEKHYKDAVSCLKEAGDRLDVARVMINLAGNQWYQNQIEEALQIYQAVVNQSIQTGDIITNTNGLLGLGFVHVSQENYMVARDTFSLIDTTYLTACGELDRLAIVKNNLGYVYTKLEEYNTAEIFLNESLALRKQTKNELAMATLLDSLATLYHQTGRLSEAREAYHEALGILKEQPDNPSYRARWEQFHERLLAVEEAASLQAANTAAASE